MSNFSLIYLLDTNACIVYLKNKNSSINRYFNNIESNKIAVCSVVKAELFYGSMRSNNPQKSLNIQLLFLNQFISLPFDDRCAEIYGTIRADLAKKGTPISSNDLQIASIALANDLILVTHNVREFSRIEGLKIEDWERELGEIV
ncbi:MAG: type II toxin-antitoxin system VapC family toxin [Scytonema sp. PMC 1069.18]|nr:type II toxin-antitoxin system VapC family toxin [Scytonema sp. PMC 1069.18]MEC4881788.1 type II toxin-antitoxin system VapC family toxin [Scytonema sp. PMC 1070.18]